MVLDYLTYDVKAAIMQHMIDDETQEVCGLITLSDQGRPMYETVNNVHDDPANNFKMAPKVAKRVSTDKNVLAYVHTHPQGPVVPSKADMEAQVKIGKTSVICARNPMNGMIEIFAHGDELLDLPLEGREFRHGCTDCYEAIRAWFWQERQVKLDAYPREDNWYHIGRVWDEYGNPIKLDGELLKLNPDMYIQNFASQGFEEFFPDFMNIDSPNHPQVGDCLLMQLDAPVINHAAVYVGNNKIYHHRYGKRSGYNAIGYLLDQNYIRHWVRRKA